MNYTKEIAEGLSHILFPHICPGCGNGLVDHDQLICIHCLNHLPLTHFEWYADNPVEKIFWGRAAISSATCQYYFTKNSVLQQLLHQFKYNNKKQIGIYFGRLMGRSLCQSNRFSGIDALVPMPLFAGRERKRGYNQAAVLCQGMASVMQLPVLNNIIERRTDTNTQTQKNRVERWKNISGKFQLIDGSLPLNKHLLLVDDVMTTGATLDACANELLRIRSVDLSMATLAYTMK